MNDLKVKRFKINKELIIGLVFVVMVLFVRAMLLGNISQLFGAIMGMTCLVFLGRYIVNKHEMIILISCFLLYIYCCINGLVLVNGSRTKLIIQITIYWVFLTFVAAVVLSNKKIEKYFGKILIIILIICTISYCISFILGMLFGWDNIRIASFDYKYGYISPVYFPLTPTYGDITFSSIKIPRMLSIGREVGISQTLYLWAYFKAGDYFKKQHLVKVFIVIGIFCCLSATGLVIFICLLLFDRLLKIKRISILVSRWQFLCFFVALVLVAIAIYLLLFGGNLSLATRMDISYVDRTNGMNYGFSELMNNPLFGSGFMRDYSDTTDVQVGIAFISSIGTIGVLGIVFFVNIFVQAFIRAENKRKFFLCNLSFLITTLFAQPIYTSALIYIFLFADYQNDSIDSRYIY